MSKEKEGKEEEKTKVENENKEEKFNNTDAIPPVEKPGDNATKTDKDEDELVSRKETDKLYARLMKEREGKEDLKSKLDEALGQLNTFKETEAQREKDKLKKKEQYEQLTQKYEAELGETKSEKERLLAENTQLNAALTITYDSMLEEIPEEKHSLIPENFTISQKIEYLTKNKHLLAPEKKVVTQKASPIGNNQDSLTEKEQLEARLFELQAKKKSTGLSHPEERELLDVARKISLANVKIQPLI